MQLPCDDSFQMSSHLKLKLLAATARNIICILILAGVRSADTARHGEVLKFWDTKAKFNARRVMARNSTDFYSRFRYTKLKDKFGHGALDMRNGFSGNTPKMIWYKNILRVNNVTNQEEVKVRAKLNAYYDNENKLQETTDVQEDTDEDEFSYNINPYEMVEQFKKMLTQFKFAKVDVEVLGRTASYNDILLFKISHVQSQEKLSFRASDDKFVQDIPQKKVIFLVHALSTMGLSKLCSLTDERYLQNLISFYLAHLDRFDVYLMPMANPDGYIQSKMLSYWNKNASPQALCAGVAVDRNFDVAWNSSHSIISCSQRYPGPYPFSEPESSAVRDVFNRFSHRIVAYFHVHSGTYDADVFKGDAVLYPKGYSESSSNDDKYVDLRAEIEEVIKNANFKILTVTVDTLYNWYGPVFGSSVDYASSVYGIPYAMELVMQIYEGPIMLNQFKKRNLNNELNFDALIEVWSRVLNVLFTNLKKIYTA